MGSYISSYFTVVEEEEISLENASQILENTIKVEKEQVNKSEFDEHVHSNSFFTQVGVITHENERCFIIDEKYSFDRSGYNFTIGSEVLFDSLTYAGNTTISNVKPFDKGWDSDEVQKSLWNQRVVICKIERRNNRDLICNPGEITLNLDKISIEFLPMVGDWLEIDVKTAIDENVMNLSGKVLDINKVLPVRPHVSSGKITVWNAHDNLGTINNTIFFNKESLSSGYMPVVGDKVVTQVIESDQQGFSWRAVKVIPEYITKTCTDKIAPISTEVDFKDSHPGLIIEDVSLNFQKLNTTQKFIMTISNESDEDFVLLDIELPNSRGQCRLLDDIKQTVIAKNSSFQITYECTAKNMGLSKDFVLFAFADFKIGKWIKINVYPTFNQSSEINESKQYKVRVYENNRLLKAPSTQNRFVAVKVPPYKIPKKLLDTVSKEELKSTDLLIAELRYLKPSLFSNLSYTNYEDKFHTLLFLEEITDIMAMRAYDRESVSFVRRGDYFTLEIENLSERRPSIIVGDRIIATEPTNQHKIDYEGYVQKVTKNEIFIKFGHQFHDFCREEDLYDIRIVAGRSSIIRLHHAVNLAIRNLGPDLLFPTRFSEKEKQITFSYDAKDVPKNKMQDALDKIHKYRERNQNNVSLDTSITGSGSSEIKLQWHNEKLNKPQKNAVKNILWGKCRPLPYFIFGPPGTGKTVTLIEAILQIVRLLPHSRLLVCAPSNSAADLIALRLIDSGILKPGDMVRLIGYNYALNDNIPVKLVPYCATASSAKENTAGAEYTKNGIQMECGLTVLGRHRVTVATCSAAGVMFNMGFTRSHFSHIVIDEAAQATEPDVLIPLSFLDKNSGQAILAGDPMQLGPVIMSKVAVECGLSESYLERIINRFPYVRDIESFPDTCGYDPRLVTKLLYNYRALPAILNLYSSLFYNGELISTIDNSSSEEAILLRSLQEMLPKLDNAETPSIIFHGVDGENYQTPDSPSWCNPHEVAQVFFYVNELYRLGLKASNIGIITPYIKQVQEIRTVMAEAEFEMPKIGTVEDFQGQEFDVILLSTVRSKQEYISFDTVNCLGFVSNPKRLNVAISRAKCLFIIIGNPNLLCMDMYWRSVIKYCHEYGQYIGCDLNI